MPYLLLAIGLAALIAGANLLVRGASRLALAVGISPLVVGLTVVAFGTSAPELAVSVQSAWSGRADIALGNVVGSNIFNILLILGLSALITPLVVARQVLRQEVPVMIGATVLLLLLVLDRALGRLDGAILLILLAGYTTFLIIQSRRETARTRDEYAAEFGSAAGANWTGRLWAQLLFIGAGLALLVVGSGWLVDGAVQLARSFGLSELVIGLTIVAAGTSMPEVVTSVTAALKGERDIAVGNVIGSCVFNILAVLGVAAALAPAIIAVPAALINFDLPVVIAVSIACLPIFFTGNTIARWEGALFLFYFCAYMAYLILAAQEHDAIATFELAMQTVVIPLTTITLLVVITREWQARRQR